MKLLKPLVVVGPSGAGKSTLTSHLLGVYPRYFKFSVSSTTRQPRDKELNGIDYYFETKEQFQKEIEAKNFIEYNEVHGNYYGTHKEQVLKVQKDGLVCVLDIDVKGARDVLNSGIVDCNYIFVTVPSLDELKRRLIARKTETPESLERRLTNAKKEIDMAKEIGIFQKWLINDDKERFIQEADQYIIKQLYDIKF